jgi:hypothetical protein
MSDPQPEFESMARPEELAVCAVREQRIRVAEFLEAASRAAYEHGDPGKPLNIRAAIPAIGCQVCHEHVTVDNAGAIVAPRCERAGTDMVSISCDLGLMRTRPELYTEEGKRVEGVQYRCGNVACNATVGWRTKGKADAHLRPHLEGICAINTAGKNYRDNHVRIHANAMPEIPSKEANSDAIPEFDGER